MQVVGQNDNGLDGKWSASAGRLEHSPKIVNVFGQESAAFQQRDRNKERASWNKGAKVLRHDFSLTKLLKAGCASLSLPTATQFRRLAGESLRPKPLGGAPVSAWVAPEGRSYPA
ncbi:MAG: hypothetical protein KKD99_10610 [Proteobacteria bacterium]|nr:hypothetical protein [Pseudomonadota bacterium]MBU4357471.1 hypothetical protein [Pseudomonadota bacterium]MBU4449029.1 hypothetical protein [Pseudomonadota bacterium]MCG2771880.1 hypothetical protein [Desulfobacterales bacterium]